MEQESSIHEQGISCYQVFAWDMDNVETESEQPASKSDNPAREVIQCSGLQECYEQCWGSYFASVVCKTTCSSAWQ